jgi:hypothetical protein
MHNARRCTGNPEPNSIIVHEKLTHRFCEKALSYSSVTNWLRCLRFGQDIFDPGIRTGKPQYSLIVFSILTELATFPFRSLWTLAGTHEIPRFAIWDRLQKGPFVMKNLRWIPHALEDVIERARVTMAESFSDNLQQARRQCGRDFLTGDGCGLFMSRIMNGRGCRREQYHILAQG